MSLSNIKKISIGAALLGIAAAAPAAHAGGLDYTFAAGYNIGGTTPMGLPAEIRSINGYNPGFNFSVGAYGAKMFSSAWGLGLGVAYETVGMKTKISARNYHLTMNILSGEGTGTRTGYFTGDIKNTTKIGYISVPVYAVFRPSAAWEFNAGLYFAAAVDREFTGEVAGGKIRETPLHAAVGIDRAEYDYSSDINRFDTGVIIAATRRVYRGLGVRASLKWGLRSVLNESTRKVDMATYNVYLNVGLTYTL